ncbi:MAG: PAS domain S-box protein, partial [Burkholderiales bacterium]|nr:PAS domain S-box protein [Burkholderiales bacterium]
MWLPVSLKSRLLLLTVLAALPVAAGMAIMALEARSTALRLATAQLEENVLDIQRQHAEIRNIMHTALSMLAEVPDVIYGDPQKCSNVLKPIAEKEDLIWGLVVFDLDGHSICNSQRGPVSPINVADRPYFKRALAERKLVSGEFHVGRVALQPVQGFALPVLDAAGAPRLVLYADVLLSKLIPAPHNNDLSYTLVDPEFKVVARSPPDQWVGKSIAGTELHRLLVAANGKPRTDVQPGLNSDARLLGYAALRSVTGNLQGYAMVSQPMTTVFAPANRALMQALILLALTVLAMVAILFSGSHVFVLKRAEVLRRALHKIAGGDLSARLTEAKDNNEFSVLDRAFNKMADRNERSMARINRLNRIYVLLSAINSAIIHIRESKALANEVTRIAVELGGYLSSSIFLIDRTTNVARAASHAGACKSHYEALEIHLDRPPTERDGPMTTLFQTGRHVVETVDGEDPGKPLSRALQRGLEFGFKAIAALPLVVEGKIIGALQLSSSNPNGFDEEEVQLLLQLSADAALGFEHIDHDRRTRESEARFRETFNQAAVGIAHISLEGRYLRVNQKFADIVDCSPDEILTKSFEDFTYPDDYAADLAVIQKLLSAEISTYTLEKRLLRRDGSIVWCTATRSLVRKPDGTPHYFLAVIQDISTRKKAEQALQETENRYRLLFESNPHPMWVYDLETLRFLAVNDTAVAHYGYTRDEFLAMTLKDIRPQEDVPRLLANIARISNDTQHTNVLVRHVKNDGTVIEVDVTSQPIEFDGRRARVSLAHDVTERNKAMHALAEAEEKFRSLVEQSLVGTYIMDAKRMHYANPRAAEIFGYTQEEITQVHLRALVVEDDWPLVESNVLSRIRGEASGLKLEFRGRRKDGSIVQIGMHGTGASSGDQRRVIGVLQDITEKQRTE